MTALLARLRASRSAAGASRSWLAAMNLGTANALTIITMLVGIVTRPMLLRLLGDDRMGSWRVLSDVTGHLSLLDLGSTSAIGVAMLRASAQGKPGEVHTWLQWGQRFLWRFAAAAAVLCGALSWWMPGIIGAPPALAGEVRLTTLLSGFGFMLVPFGLNRAALEATQQGYLVNGALLAQSFCITGLTLAFAFAGLGLPSYGLATLSGAAVYYAIIRRQARRLLKPAPTQVIEPEAKWVIRHALPLLGTSITNRIGQFTDSFVIARLLSVGAVFQLEVTQLLIRLTATQVGSLANATWAGLAELREREGVERFEERLVELIRVMVSLGMIVTGTVGAFNQQFVSLWVGQSHYGGMLLSIFSVCSSIVVGYVVTLTFILDTGGYAQRRLVATLIGAAIKVVCSIMLTRSFGIAGVAMGTFLGYLLVEAWYCPLLLCRIYGIRAWPMVRGTLTGIGATLPFSVSTWFVASRLTFKLHWLTLIAELCFVSALGLAYWWVVVLTRHERDRWLMRLPAWVRAA